MLIAGFWNYKLVDGFGREVVAGNTIGNADVLAKTFASNGMLFGVVFAGVASLAATFTACNCVVFAMLPGSHAARTRTPHVELLSRLLASSPSAYWSSALRTGSTLERSVRV